MYDPFASPPPPGMVQTMGAPTMGSPMMGAPAPGVGMKRGRVPNALEGVADKIGRQHDPLSHANGTTPWVKPEMDRGMGGMAGFIGNLDGRFGAMAQANPNVQNMIDWRGQQADWRAAMPQFQRTQNAQGATPEQRAANYAQTMADLQTWRDDRQDWRGDRPLWTGMGG